MEIRIGVMNVGRELVIDADIATEEVQTLIEKSLQENQPLVLSDSRGHTITVPSDSLGYVDIAPEQKGRVGFGV